MDSRTIAFFLHLTIYLLPAALEDTVHVISKLIKRKYIAIMIGYNILFLRKDVAIFKLIEIEEDGGNPEDQRAIENAHDAKEVNTA